MKRNKTLFVCAAALLILAGCTTAKAQENPFPASGYQINNSNGATAYCHEDHEHNEHCYNSSYNGQYCHENHQHNEHCYNSNDRDDNYVQAKADNLGYYENTEHCDRNHRHNEHCYNGNRGHRNNSRRHHRGSCHN